VIVSEMDARLALLLACLYDLQFDLLEVGVGSCGCRRFRARFAGLLTA